MSVWVALWLKFSASVGKVVLFFCFFLNLRTTPERFGVGPDLPHLLVVLVESNNQK